eukprot:m.135798 g.135798  ORF g.135798 m.135798 type:complete len:306 (+) comp29821_c0_seq2:408-1325(+)
MGRDLFANLQSKPEIADPEPERVDDDDDYEEDEEDEQTQFMNSFFDEVKMVRDTIAKIQEQIELVEVKHERLLVAYSQVQTTEAKSALEETMGRITALANKTRANLKKMAATNKELLVRSNDRGEGMDADIRIRETQLSSLVRNFSSVMNRYNDIQAQNKKKYRDAIKHQCKIVDENVSDEVIDKYVENGQSAEVFKGKKLDEAEKQLSDIKDRHEDIKRLERSLMELHEMFVDMSILVSEQGDMVDRIENQVAKSAEYVESAKKKLVKARALQSSARRKKYCCLTTLLVVIGVIVLLIVLDQTS